MPYNLSVNARWIAIVALALTACAPTRNVAELTAETPETQLLREHAFATWADVGVETPGDYRLGLLPNGELQGACEVSDVHKVSGCTFHDERVILIDADASLAMQRKILVHEVGHIARGHHGHLQCDRTGRGPDLMCGIPVGDTLTARDIAFVLAE